MAVEAARSVKRAEPAAGMSVTAEHSAPGPGPAGGAAGLRGPKAAAGLGGSGSEQRELPGRGCARQPGKRIKTGFETNPLNRRQ